MLELHEGNNRDDNVPWFKFTKWLKYFEGKDLKVKFSFYPCLIFFLVDRSDAFLEIGILWLFGIEQDHGREIAVHWRMP